MNYIAVKAIIRKLIVWFLPIILIVCVGFVISLFSFCFNPFGACESVLPGSFMVAFPVSVVFATIYIPYVLIKKFQIFSNVQNTSLRVLVFLFFGLLAVTCFIFLKIAIIPISDAYLTKTEHSRRADEIAHYQELIDAGKSAGIIITPRLANKTLTDKVSFGIDTYKVVVPITIDNIPEKLDSFVIDCSIYDSSDKIVTYTDDTSGRFISTADCGHIFAKRVDGRWNYSIVASYSWLGSSESFESTQAQFILGVGVSKGNSFPDINRVKYTMSVPTPQYMYNPGFLVHDNLISTGEVQVILEK